MSNENKPNYEVKIPLEVDGNWEYFTCNVVVMGCCMGEYLSIVNKKEITF